MNTATDQQGRTMAQRALDLGNERPYDAPDDWWDQDIRKAPPAPVDWAHTAARAIIYDLGDRRGIKNEIEQVDEETRVELVASMAEIIRAAHQRRGDGA